MASVSRIDRELAKVLLSRIDSLLTTKSDGGAREELVLILNREVAAYSWVGIYLLKGNELSLDAWSGSVGAGQTRIPLGKGIGGWAAKTGKTEIVSDVSKDSRHTEGLETKSEIVVPITYQGKVVGELDVHGNTTNAFSSLDREFLEAVAKKMASHTVG